MAEPNDNSEDKKEIIIHPTHDLLSNTAYILIISEKLRGGNQKLLGTDTMITFTTGDNNIAEIDKKSSSIA